MFKKLLLIIFVNIFTTKVHAAATCEGKILELVKWSTEQRDLSILLEGTNRYIQFKDETSKSMLLLAFAAQKKIRVKWSTSDVTSCTDGWPHYAELNGYLVVYP